MYLSFTMITYFADAGIQKNQDACDSETKPLVSVAHVGSDFFCWQLPVAHKAARTAIGIQFYDDG